MNEIRIPTNVSELTQEDYERYVLHVKALLYSFDAENRQVLLIPETLRRVSRGYEIVSVPQSNSGVLLQLRKTITKLDTLITEFNNLSDDEKAQFRAALGV